MSHLLNSRHSVRSYLQISTIALFMLWVERRGISAKNRHYVTGYGVRSVSSVSLLKLRQFEWREDDKMAASCPHVHSRPKAGVLTRHSSYIRSAIVAET